LLCRHHRCELEIPLYRAHRFLNRDYFMFDCGGMAFSEAGFYASIAIVERIQTAPLPEWRWLSYPPSGLDTWRVAHQNAGHGTFLFDF
jgi:hypothetical protein